MNRIVLLVAALGLALAVAVAASHTPDPAPATAADTAFSATRAMVDVEAIAQAPHPTGSEENARVRAYLMTRMAELGVNPSEQTGPLPEASVARLGRWGDEQAAERQITNLIGVLPGRDREGPAVLLVAHHDTVWDSPGAADDSAGVAAILEAVRAIQARGPAERDLIVLFTDAEELGLDGMRLFLNEHSLAQRVGMVVNLEARGGGGRASMFETGPGNGQTVRAFTRAMDGVEGGANSNSLAVLVYENMPNGTDYTLARERGIAGVNLAFIGRAHQYHDPASTPDALDRGSVQHIGEKALETADHFLRADALPMVTRNVVYSDLLGLFFVQYAPWVGWLVLAAAGGFLIIAVWRGRTVGAVTFAGMGLGALGGLWLAIVGVVLATAMRGLAGPSMSRSGSPELYYAMLRRLPWLEAGVVLSLLAATLILFGSAQGRRRLVAGALILTTIATLTLYEFSWIPFVLGLIAVGGALYSGWMKAARFSAWTGLIALMLVLGVVVQALAPTAAFLIAWPVLGAALAAATGGLIDPRLERHVSLWPAVIVTAVLGGWLFALGHWTFLGVGMDLPGVLTLIALLAAMLARPLAPTSRRGLEILAVLAAVALFAGAGLALGARIIEPVPTEGHAT
ncbi:M20/M25/M40 family metallo-hydrolase [Brevundimonas sp.]|uniref:M20/M25/M40 family metallo-hydrolase n=1 Tax=Brevundimonas sp. TaxID=1871086 RepID=UPI003918D9F5